MLIACVVTVSLVFYLSICHLNKVLTTTYELEMYSRLTSVFKFYLLEDKQRFKFRGV